VRHEQAHSCRRGPGTILRDLLSTSGYTVIEAVDGAEGVAKAASERPDLVLMDIQLPVLDGYDATRQIKALPGFAAIPIIAVSSFAMKGDEEKARTAVLHKCGDPREALAQAIGASSAFAGGHAICRRASTASVAGRT
jgi:two-component system, cell cycle response regulator DivK